MDNVVIIIPAYHASLTLEKCLASIQKQTYKEFAAIVVDDGNEDDSLRTITEFFSKSDGRFRYARQKNQGPGVARNYGLSLVRDLDKKWVVFVDSDDYVEPEYVERLIKKANETGCRFVSTGGEKGTLFITGEEALCALADGKFIMGVYDRIVHGSLLLDNPFGTWSRYGEDTVATFRELAQLSDKKIALYFESFGYHYVNNPLSSTHDPLTPAKAIEYVYLWARIYEESISRGVPEICKARIVRRLDAEYLQMCGHIELNWPTLTKESQEKYLFAKNAIVQGRLLRRYMPKTFGERFRCVFCRVAPHLYCRIFSKP